MSLIHPSDLTAWQASIDSGRGPIHSARALVRRLRPAATTDSVAADSATLVVPDDAADVLIVIDTPTTSQLAALMAPLRFLPPERVAVLTMAASRPRLPIDTDLAPTIIGDHHDLARALPNLRCVLSYGHYMRLGALADAAARTVGATRFVAQHGLLTPFAPPLPHGASLLAWSAEDARYWSEHRPDVETHVVGSQLLHDAAAEHTSTVGASVDSGGITYLGQLHGYELPRRSMAAAATRFCRTNDAVYRPHPSESDLTSRLQHSIWRSRGIRFDLSRRPLAELDTAVVSVFSTGVLEAAAAGRDAWVDFPDPPEWLNELWRRYRMQRYGSAEPTRIEFPAHEPARAVAELIISTAGTNP